MSRVGPVDSLVAVGLLLVLLTAGAAPGAGSQTGPQTLASVGQIEPDTVLLDVSIREDGDATWEIRYRVRLDDENATAAFDSLEQDIEENRSAFTSRFEERMGRTVRAAENATGRDMAVRNVSVRTTRQEIPQQYGVLIYRVEWTNFAVADGDRIEAGDAIGGLYLDESTSLTVHWPQGYGVASTDPEPDESGDRSLTWQGPQDFTAEQPRIVLSTEADSGDGGAPGGDGDGDTPAFLLALVALVAVAGVIGAGLWWRDRRPDEPGPTATPDATTDDEPPEELLSNEERVLRLLEQHGGRMKQQRVVEELEWTDAKTSQVVGDLRDSGEIEAFRLGRENVLTLPEEDEDDLMG